MTAHRRGVLPAAAGSGGRRQTASYVAPSSCANRRGFKEVGKMTDKERDWECGLRLGVRPATGSAAWARWATGPKAKTPRRLWSGRTASTNCLGENWGQLPEGCVYREGTAVAVDFRDLVYFLNRGTCPVIVFDTTARCRAPGATGCLPTPTALPSRPTTLPSAWTTATEQPGSYSGLPVTNESPDVTQGTLQQVSPHKRQVAWWLIGRTHSQIGEWLTIAPK